ncbi:MAG: branched-chain amino acid aminotransferase [Hymenobacteraceae bacterium]|nr:branched-chain amino acid aminotransferase [Hymenobacteraceae bacterium]MDX5396340.1 branched-chain amino acid aminotransferase [Hymenobacteraceae bacterium]MDX5443671.1 branched-chain amino acid aminotransferase [Hymenobacteraceae bacterium]MDX5512400.1 branched-chain amino acid aminotransferase [Hymenobacteraceae bacterium]
MITDLCKNINIQQVAESRISELDYNNIQFGTIFSDHMLIADFENGEWQSPQIVPYGNLALSPATSAIHYGQSIFEGMKAYKNPQGEVVLFRPLDNFKRLNKSAVRMCMPELPEEIFMQGLTQLLQLDNKWVPPTSGCALYLRPFMFATDDFIGVRPSSRYKFIIFSCPVNKYYAAPLRVKIEQQYVRSVEGGAGFAKAAGNYGAALYPAKLAQENGYHQLIWTDAYEHKYIEESGTMNIMFVIGDKLITPALSTSILAGITRDSVLTLARDWGMTVEERKVSIDEVIEAQQNGTLKEAFGVGTAATIAPIQVIGYKDQDYELPEIETREFSNKVAHELEQIRTGQAPDPYGWIYKV